MRILMLGWEFPPFISGGLGVACYGLTRSLDRAGHEVMFILPKPVDRGHGSHVRLLSPWSGASAEVSGEGSDAGAAPVVDHAGKPLYGFQHTVFHGVQATFGHPYPSFAPAQFVPLSSGPTGVPTERDIADVSEALRGELPEKPAKTEEHKGAPPGYGFDLVSDSERYARLVVALARGERFDVIHAHDWLTYPAGIAMSKISGRPLVVHVHSTEFDRAGNNVNQRVYDIERAGMQAATRVIAVSQFTKSICVRRYSVNPARVDVVYNGIDQERLQPRAGEHIDRDDKIVLFLGRITMQKGPEYFIAAAKRVLEKLSRVKFVLAGSGDMAVRMIELAASMGIGHKVLFTGFLRGRDLERVFQMADCYVMPSVSEPFGIAALEAIKHDVPVILSKTSGASEVLRHVLKVDFWDIDEMANKILAVLRHPPLSQTLREHGSIELHRLTWEGAAERCVDSYRRAIEGGEPAVAGGRG